VKNPTRAGGSGRAAWIAKYYRDRRGVEPVKDFIDTLPPEHQETLDRKIDRLNVFGPMIPAPHSKKVRGKLRRLKCDFDGLSYRILYREAESGFIVLLHIFVKKTPKIPAAETELAESRWNDCEQRMNALKKIPPRALGRDAP
jgi:phage-related protein